MPRSDTHLLRRASEDDLDRYAHSLGLSLDDQERADYTTLVNGTLESFEAVMEAPPPEVGPRTRIDTPRPAARIPSDGEDPLNAWIRRTEVSGASDGPLADLTVGIKDSIALAGYPMTLGSEVMEGFVPTDDATVVHRLLEAGATIVGKQNMESFAFSGSGDTSDFGPVLNPHSDAHLAGGSSSGSAAAVANGDCDLSIGTDQAGSVRIPSACCGTVGLKPTTGLVPYTGAFPLDLGIDHLGPIASSVETVARALEVIAGEDVIDGVRLDPRQPRGVSAEAYTEVLDRGLEDVSVGVLEEGFEWPFSDPDVDETVRGAIDVLNEHGAATEDVSVERHRVLSSAAGVVATVGGARTMAEAGLTRGAEGWYWQGFAEMFEALRTARADSLPPSVKQALLTTAHVRDVHGMGPYALAQNLALEAERAYDALLDTHDVLVLPTVVVPPLAYEPELDRVEATSREWMLAANTAAFDLTGHPALSIPCGMTEGLPVGMMVVGAHFEESTVLQVASAFEQAVDWTTR